MTWCDRCNREFDIGLVDDQGGCPACGQWLGDPPSGGSVPWHFWVVVTGAVLYLGWRALEGIVWVLQQIT
ncbi:MAG: hypothetical protein VYC75_11145 [Actinomycetota bacterium]|nr:hypothetical protein [Acidimicrobiaceae bacterium]MEC9271134.1 hypothetical protein [Actinomycetota bacterium]